MYRDILVKSIMQILSHVLLLLSSSLLFSYSTKHYQMIDGIIIWKTYCKKNSSPYCLLIVILFIYYIILYLFINVMKICSHWFCDLRGSRTGSFFGIITINTYLNGLSIYFELIKNVVLKNKEKKCKHKLLMVQVGAISKKVC